MSGTSVALKQCEALFALMSRQYSRENTLYVKQETTEALVCSGWRGLRDRHSWLPQRLWRQLVRLGAGEQPSSQR